MLHLAAYGRFSVFNMPRKHNGTLRCIILPIQNAVDLYNQRQLRRLEETVEQMRVRKKLEGSEEHPGRENPLRHAGTLGLV